MIPYLDELLKMNARGEMPLSVIVPHVIKSIALTGDRSDFDELPSELKHAVATTLDGYEGTLLLISSEGSEDCAPYANEFIRKVGSYK